MSITRQTNLILASSSPRRQELIRFLQLPFSVIPSHADETVTEPLRPADLVQTLSLRKAEAVVPQVRPDGRSIIVGSDTVVVIRERILGKPADENEAVRMLQLLQGQVHEVYSGVACIDLEGGTRLVRHRMTKVRMKPLDEEQIRRYVATGEPMDKAGAYAIQGLGALVVEAIEGCYFNVVGLPLSLLNDMLAELGVQVI